MVSRAVKSLTLLFQTHSRFDVPYDIFDVCRAHGEHGAPRQEGVSQREKTLHLKVLKTLGPIVFLLFGILHDQVSAPWQQTMTLMR